MPLAPPFKDNVSQHGEHRCNADAGRKQYGWPLFERIHREVSRRSTRLDHITDSQRIVQMT